MASEPQVSVVIPNYNHTRYLSAAIDSALAQSCPPLEVVVVDDGSTDGCRDVVRGYGDRVRYHFQANQGLAAARNTGITLARGRFVGLLDADDAWLPEFLASFGELAARHPDASAYYAAARAVDAQGHLLPTVFGGPPCDPANLRQRLLRANFLIPSTMVLRRADIVAAGLFDASLRSCEDWDLWLRLLPDHQFVGTGACLVLYRQHDDSLSRNPEGMRRAALAVIAKHFGPDEGRLSTWSDDKRRAYGGVYSYLALVSVQRTGDWLAAERHLRRALQVDPSVALGLDLFYALAHGTQPLALRGTAKHLDLAANAGAITALVDRVCAAPGVSVSPEAALGTAYHALGLVAYNTRHFALSRRYLARAARYRPRLLRDRTVVGDLAKSLVAPFIPGRRPR
jgi:glycosyltransferase involved in cell wall biosynthesis